jgi:hypothetical protein
MGLFRLIFIFLIGYFIVKMVKRFLQPGQPNPNVRGQSKKQDNLKDRNNIQDIDYEELD